MSYNVLHTYLVDRKYDLIPSLLLRNKSGRSTAAVQLYGEYPLHIALKNEAPDQVVMLLMEAYPAALNVMNRKGEYPDELAERLGYPEKVVKALRIQHQRNNPSGSSTTISSGSSGEGQQHRRSMFQQQVKAPSSRSQRLLRTSAASVTMSSRTMTAASSSERNMRASTGSLYSTKYKSNRDLLGRRSSLTAGGLDDSSTYSEQR